MQLDWTARGHEIYSQLEAFDDFRDIDPDQFPRNISHRNPLQVSVEAGGEAAQLMMDVMGARSVRGEARLGVE